MPTISVIIPLYNKEQCINKTIDSVLTQTFQDYEIIVVNDGSTDKSLGIVQSIKDDRLHIINKDNEGVSATRNRGAKEANSDLLFFLDADDVIYPNCFEILLQLRKDFPEASLWSGNYEMAKDTETMAVLDQLPRGYVRNPSKMMWLRKWHFRMGTFICTKESFWGCGGFDTRMTIGEDYLMIDSYIMRFPCAYDPSILMAYIFDNKGLTSSLKPIECYLEWYLDFRDMAGYQKMRYGEMIGAYMVARLLDFRLSYLKKMMMKYWKYIPYSTYCLFRRRLENFII